VRDGRPSTAACPACWAIGTKIVYGEEKNICSGRLQQPRHKAEQKSLVLAQQAQQNQPRKDPFHLYSLSSQSPQFQQSAGATPLSTLSDLNIEKNAIKHICSFAKIAQLVDTPARLRSTQTFWPHVF
jgi:hypothetical protein